MAAYYAAADAFVIPTLEDNWSLVVPEAMACGLPILCSKYSGCWPELVQEGNGWVFDPLDHQDTLRVLNLCIQKGSELPGMGRESRTIIAGHTPQHAARSIYEACRIATEQAKVRVRS
jgi:glycosyltransferase involved in cell wall biosynthesis